MKPRRILSLLLALALCLSLLPLTAVPARAAGGGEQDYWDQNNNCPVFDTLFLYLKENYDAVLADRKLTEGFELWGEPLVNTKGHGIER